MPDMTDKRFFALGSMPVAIGLMVLLVILLLTGVIPVRGGDADVVFRTPVFAVVMGLLGASTLACLRKRRFSWRSAGFHLTHLAVPLIMAGALAGTIWERRGHIQLSSTQPHPIDRVLLSDGTPVELGFGLSLKSFHVEHYPPDIGVYRQGELAGKLRSKPGARFDLGDVGVITVAGLRDSVNVVGFDLAGPAELVVFNAGEEWKRLSLEEDPGHISLPNGDTLLVARVFNNLPRMKGGRMFSETDYPVRPGLILRVLSGERMAVLSLEAGKEPELLSPTDSAQAPDIPDIRYTYPDMVNVRLEDEPADSGVAAVSLDTPAGRCTLLHDGGRNGSHLLGHNVAVRLLPSVDKTYTAQLTIHTDASNSVVRTLQTNHPVNHHGWRLYLDSYDRDNGTAISITARHDPGDTAVVAGILMLMIGVPTLFFTRGDKPC